MFSREKSGGSSPACGLPGLDAPCVRIIALQAASMLVIGWTAMRSAIPILNPLTSADMWLYYGSSARLRLGLLPYRDFPLEYPPLALASFAVPQLLHARSMPSFPTYVGLFLAWNAALCILTAWIVYRIAVASRATRSDVTPERAVAIYAGLAVVLTPLLPWRYDLFPAFLTVLAFSLAISPSKQSAPGASVRKPVWAGAALGFGIAAKLYPIVLLPVLTVYYLAQRRSVAVRELWLGTLAAIGAAVLPFARVGPRAMLSFLSYHEKRGLEIESLPAGVLMASHFLYGLPARIAFDYGAFNLQAPGVARWIAALPWLFLLAYAALVTAAYVAFRKEFATGRSIRAETLAVGLVGALVAFMATNKVLSPQYVIWLMPFVPFAGVRLRRVLCVVCVLTTLIFPFAFGSLLAMNPTAVCLLNFRNDLLLTAFGMSIYVLASDLFPVRKRAAKSAENEPAESELVFHWVDASNGRGASD